MSTTAMRSMKARDSPTPPSSRIAHERFWNGYLDELRARLGEPDFRLGDDTLIVLQRFRIVERLDLA